MKQSELDQFIGTEQYWKHWTGVGVYTDGVKYLAEKAGAFWLLDVIFSYQKRKEPFQLWILRVNEDKSAVVTMQEDCNTKVLIKQEFNFTTFPFKEIRLFYIDGVLLLPSEY